MVLQLITLFILSGLVGVRAQMPTELKRLYRCYAIFSSTRIPSSHPLINQVKSGSKSGTQACMKLFDSAALGSNNQVNQSSTFAMNALRKFHQMHKNFFGSVDFWEAFEQDATPNIIDMYDGANFLTWMLLKPNQAFNQIVTGTQGYKAIRASTNQTTKLLIGPDSAIGFAHGTPDQTYNANTLVDEGILIGLRPDDTQNPMSQIPGIFSGTYTTTNVNEHKGGGMLGLQSYLLANMGTIFGIKPNGGTRTYRRLTTNILKDFLCRDIPVLREGDIEDYIAPNSAFSFRKSSTCVACHATIDQMAGVYRNIISVNSIVQGLYGFRYMPRHATNLDSANIFPTSNDSGYFRRPPEGRFMFRSYDGSLINQEITGINQLGSLMAQTNDLPVCFAAKYYKAFTGIEVNLQDQGSPLAQTLSSGEQFHRDQVISLGLALKNHQSLRTLIQNIIASQAFVNPGQVPQ